MMHVTTVLWGIDGFLRRPAFVEARPDRAIFDLAAQILRPLLHCLRLAERGYTPIRTLVVHVNFLCNPAAIRRFISSITIDPVDAQILGISSAGCPVSEADKACAPLVANGDASSPVKRIELAVGIEATLLHAAPDIVQPSSLTAMYGLKASVANTGIHRFSIAHKFGPHKSAAP